MAVAGVGTWLGFTAHVRAGSEYAAPAYEYQRAGYQFYNVSYADNMSYVDPFRPELGLATGRELLDRVRTNVVGMPMTLGEGVSVHRGWWRGEVDKVNERLPGLHVPQLAADVAVTMLCLPVIGGLV